MYKRQPQGGGATDWALFAAGTNSSCAVKTTGTLWCWGDNSTGQVGDGTTTQRTSLVQISSGITDWTDVTVGNQMACARRATGNDVYCWGANHFGTVGIGTLTTSVLTPAAVAADAVSGRLARLSGALTMCVVDGTTLRCWGRDEEGELGYVVSSAAPAQVSGGAVYRF